MKKNEITFLSDSHMKQKIFDELLRLATNANSAKIAFAKNGKLEIGGEKNDSSSTYNSARKI